MKLKDFDFRIVYENDIIDDCIAVYNDNGGYIMLGDEDVKEDFEIELWTGFRDKGGAKIFSGDIINFRDKNYLVELNKKLELSVICRTKDCVYRMNTSKSNFKNCKVIGNIHENPQLLEQQSFNKPIL